MIDPATKARREAEERDAPSIAALHAMYERWDAEDRETRAGKSAQARELAELRRRVRQLEARDAMSVKALGEVIAKREKALEARLLKEIGERGHMAYRGVFDHERAYARGDVVTHTGSAWIATGPVAPGEKPGRAPGWKMMTKSGSTSSGVVA